MKRAQYDPARDSAGSYAAAVEAKRLRGDTHWPEAKDRAPDPETEREMKRLKRALDRKLREATAEGRKGDRPSAPLGRPTGAPAGADGEQAREVNREVADPFDRARFAASVRRRLDGVSVRRAVEAFPALNIAMISRARKGENLTIGSFLTLCKALRLRPLDFYVVGVKRRRVTRKTIFDQTVTVRVPRETRPEPRPHGGA